MSAIHYLSQFIGFAKTQGRSPEELANWVLAQLNESGYFGFAGGQSIDEYVTTFAEGRRKIYREVAVENDGSGFRVRSRLWYKEDSPQAFLLFDVGASDILAYGRRLAEGHAKALGIRVEIENDKDFEVARIRAQERP